MSSDATRCVRLLPPPQLEWAHVMCVSAAMKKEEFYRAATIDRSIGTWNRRSLLHTDLPSV